MYHTRFSCVEVMESVVARTADRNPVPNAIVYRYSDRALNIPTHDAPMEDSPKQCR